MNMPIWDIDTVRPWAYLLTLFLGLGALVWLVWLGRSTPRLAALSSLRLMGVVPWLVLVGVLGLLLGVFDLSTATRLRLVESTVPLAIALQAAFAFAPDQDPSLELLLSYPRRPFWVLLERLLMLVLVGGVLALLTTGMVLLFIESATPVLMLLRWIPSAVLLSGVALYVTLRSRNGLFGAVVTLMVWFVMIFLGESLLPDRPSFFPLNYIQPFIWIIQPYLQPESLADADYWLNRFAVSALGVNLLALAVYQLHDLEWVLLGGEKSR